MREAAPGALIPADVRARLKSLRLAGRLPATAGTLGQHVSRHRGMGLEFAQYRAYEPGDEPRRIDWKLYARSDRYFVTESERDSALRLWLVLDASASMRQADRARPGWRKFDAMRAIAACLIELAVRQGDRFGVVLVGDRGLEWVMPGGGPRHRDQALLTLARATPRGAFPAPDALRPLWQHLAPGSLVIGLSDAFDDGYVAFLEALAGARREVISIQLLGADERDFPFRGGHRFIDPETGDELRLDAAAARDDFLARFNAARAGLQARLARAGVRHVDAMLDAPIDTPLRALFAARGADAKGA